MDCVLCNEPITALAPNVNKGQPMHRECLLRSSMGGIGHLIDHEHFCEYLGDPDAGLPRRLSALLVDAFVAYHGVDKAVSLSMAEL